MENDENNLNELNESKELDNLIDFRKEKKIIEDRIKEEEKELKQKIRENRNDAAEKAIRDIINFLKVQGYKIEEGDDLYNDLVAIHNLFIAALNRYDGDWHPFRFILDLTTEQLNR